MRIYRIQEFLKGHDLPVNDKSTGPLQDALFALHRSGELSYLAPPNVPDPLAMNIGTNRIAWAVVDSVRNGYFFNELPLKDDPSLAGVPDYNGHPPAGPVQIALALGDTAQAEDIARRLESTVDYLAALEQPDSLEWHCRGRHGFIARVGPDEVAEVARYLGWVLGGATPGHGLWAKPSTEFGCIDIEFSSPPQYMPWNICGKGVYAFDKHSQADQKEVWRQSAELHGALWPDLFPPQATDDPAA